MDDPEAVRAFHESAATVQMPAYEFNAAMMSRLVPRNGTVLDLGSGSGQLNGMPSCAATSTHTSESKPDAEFSEQAEKEKTN